MSEKQNNETLCDFIRGLRSQADEIAKHLGDQHTFVEQKKQLADRLDQIRMRMEIEQAKLRGNSAALREALEKIDAMETPHNFQIERSDIADACYDLTRAIKLAHAALAAPPRNCDKYNTTQSATRKWAEMAGASIYAEGDGNDWRKFFHWLYAEAKEGGSK